MSGKMTCDNWRELLPLLYAKSLSDNEEKLIREHLRECQGCHALLKEEWALYAAASSEDAFSPLTEHPASDTLDRYVYAASGLTSEERARVKDHLSSCELCSEMVSRLAELPTGLDDLIPGEELPLLSQVSDKPRTRAHIVDIGRRIFWHPMMGYAAAVVILLASVLLRESPISPTMPTVSGTISSSSRGSKQAAVFFTESIECLLVLKYNVGPEPGHQYDIEIRSGSASRQSQAIRDYRDFDPQGVATLKALVEIGEYRLIISDIEDGDTIRIERPFEIRSQD